MSDENFHSPTAGLIEGMKHLVTARKSMTRIDEVKRSQLALTYLMSETFPFLKTHADTMCELYVSDEKGTSRKGLETVLKSASDAQKANALDKVGGFLGSENR